MKKIFNILLSFTILIIFAVCPFLPSKKVVANSFTYGEIVMEKTSKRILYEHNADQKLPMASTTKIVTAITVIENFDTTKTVTVDSRSVGVEGSSIYLKEGDKFTVMDLLYGLMLRSGNDSATALSLLCGSVENFSSLMNETAKKCGAVNSNFVNPHGLHDENHYTTAKDLALITCYAMQNKTFKEIVSAKSYTATEMTTGEKRYWVNKNKMLNSFSGATGVKTGYTKKAGRCLVSSAERDEMEVVCVVLNVPSMFERSKTLLERAFNEYKLIKIIDSKKFDYEIPNENKTKYCKIAIKNDLYYPIKNGERITAELDLPKFINESVKKGEKVGQIKIYASKQLIFYQNIYKL